MADSCLGKANWAVKIMHWLGSHPSSKGTDDFRTRDTGGGVVAAIFTSEPFIFPKYFFYFTSLH